MPSETYHTMKLTPDIHNPRYTDLDGSRFSLAITYRTRALGFRVERWGYRLMLIWWHLCWHRRDDQ